MIWTRCPQKCKTLDPSERAQYSISDVEHLLKWFDTTQSEWGVLHLVQQAIVEYAKFLMVSVEIARSRDYTELRTPTQFNFRAVS